MKGNVRLGQGPQALGYTMSTIGTPYDKIIKQATQSLAAWTPKQMRQSAAQQAAAQIAPLITASKASGQAEQAILRDQQNRAAGFATALASYAPQSQQVTNEQYRQAAAALGGLGTGLTGAVGQAWQQAADQAARETAAQTGGAGQVGGYTPSGLQSTAQLTDVSMPAATLGGQAAAVAQQAGAREAAGAAQANYITQDIGQQIIDAARQREAEQTGLRGKRPEIYQEALTGLRGDVRQQQQYLGQLAGLAQQFQQGAVSAQQAQTQLGQGQQQIDISRWQTRKQVGLSEKQIKNQVYQWGKNFGLDKRQQGIAEGQLRLQQKDQRFQHWYNRQQLGQGQEQLGITRDLADNTLWQTAMQYTKRDPKTGEPIGGYLVDPQTGAVVSAETMYQVWNAAKDRKLDWWTAKKNAELTGQQATAKATAAESKQKLEWQRVNPTLSRGMHMLVNDWGFPITRGGQTVPYALPGEKERYKPMTGDQRSKAIATANSAASTAAQGFNENSPGWDPTSDQPMEPMGYLDAKELMVRQGYFATPEKSKIAMEALKKAYRPVFLTAAASAGLGDLSTRFGNELKNWFGTGKTKRTKAGAATKQNQTGLGATGNRYTAGQGGGAAFQGPYS